MLLFGGQGKDVARQIVTIGTATGLARREVFVDARDLVETGSVTLTQHGQEELDDAAQQLYLKGDVLAQSPFVYEKDWDLSDIVTVRNGCR